MSKLKDKVKSLFKSEKHKKVEAILNGGDIVCTTGGTWGNQTISNSITSIPDAFNAQLGELETRLLKGEAEITHQEDMREKSLTLEKVLNEYEPFEDLVKAAKERHGA